MVRRGSTVRVRQRALQKRRKGVAFCFTKLARFPIVRWVVEPFIEPPDPEGRFDFVRAWVGREEAPPPALGACNWRARPGASSGRRIARFSLVRGGCDD